MKAIKWAVEEKGRHGKGRGKKEGKRKKKEKKGNEKEKGQL